jgi:hypothetical protein
MVVDEQHHTDEDLVSGYLECLSAGGDGEYAWAFDEVLNILADDPERLWRLTLEMIRRTTDELLLATVAAGPLEDLLCKHGSLFIDRVEALALSDQRFRSCLSNVWGHIRMELHIHERVRRAAASNA